MNGEPVSLSEMQEMESEDYEDVERYDYRGSVSPKRVIRHLIELAADDLSWQGRSNSNSLRDFWYNPTKPVVERAFPEKVEDPEFKFSRRMSQYLSDTMSEMVKDGHVSYRELNILDDSRERKVETNSLEADKILFCEKDAAYRKLKPLQKVYKLTLVSGSGYQATALIEDLAHELDNGNTEYDLYVLSDYDPTGFGIVEDFRSRAEKLGIDVEQVTRLGIEPSQLDYETVEQQKFSPPVNSEADEEWMDEYGIDGRYGLELEAIGDLGEKGPELRKVVIEALKPDIREDERRLQSTRGSTGSVVSSAVQSIVSDVTGDLEDGLREEMVEIMREAEGIVEVEDSGFGNPSVEIEGLDEATEAELVADPPAEGSLHRGAQKGHWSGANRRSAAAEAQRRLKEKVRDGEIEIEDLLDLEGYDE